MAPQSLRNLLAHAGNFFSQIPISLSGLPGRLVALPPLPQGAGLTSTVPYEPLSGAPPCPIDGPLSCHNSTSVAGNSCCFIHPGGRMLLTQFWDSRVHAEGAEEAWTIHGLWPDLCTSGYDSYCAIVPQYTNITQILSAHGQTELLEFMGRYWLADRGSNAHLWTHEYNKHATCINTLAPACYSYSSSAREGNPGEMAVVDYFTRATALFKTLDTYMALDRAGITPHPWKRYPLADVKAALERHVGGGSVVLRCVRSGERGGGGGRPDVLREAWYAFFVKGSLQTGEFVPARDMGKSRDDGNCAPWVRYLPKERKVFGEL